MYGINIDVENRICAYSYKNISDWPIEVDELPNGEPFDYLYENGEYVYDPLPAPEPSTPPPTQQDQIDANAAAIVELAALISEVMA